MIIGMTALILVGCSIEKISTRKTKNIDFTVVSENEIPTEVINIIEENKDIPFKVTYSNDAYTYIIIGYGKQNYEGYSISVKNLYETSNAICVKTEFTGPEKVSNKNNITYPYIVIKIEYTDKNVIFSE